MPRPVTLDTNVAILLTVGALNTDLLKKHGRVKEYDSVDFQVLDEAVQLSSGLIWLPHVLAETSNLLVDIYQGAHGPLRQTLGMIIAEWPEQYVSSARGAARPEHHYLGLTDVVLMELAATGVTVITTDGRLHDAILRAGHASIRFQELRDERRPIFLQD